MAFTQAQLDTLEAAIAAGTLSVQYGDKRVTYHSMGEMLQLRDQMKREITSSGNPRRFTVLKFGRD